jgi:hypothetical protein
MSYRILLAIIALLVLAGFLLIACGDEEGSDDANDDDSAHSGDNNDDDVDDDVDDDYLNDDSDVDAEMQVESSFEYLDEEFTDLFDLDPDDESDCGDSLSCDTPLNRWLCDFQNEWMWMWGECYCHHGCCHCDIWTR